MNQDLDTHTMTVIIPAFNEESVLPRTLELVGHSAAGLSAPPEVVVVDNRSTDATSRIAKERGARVVREEAVGIAHARNAGARAASSDVLVFIDADATFPAELLPRIEEAMRDPQCAGGAADARYEPARHITRAYLRGWHVLGKAMKMSQGAVQFLRRDVFEALDGYDTRYLMGEDVDFMWRVRRHARNHDMTAEIPLPVPVVQSSRRFDRWPFWRTFVWTNPLFISAFRRRASAWADWYEHPPR